MLGMCSEHGARQGALYLFDYKYMVFKEVFRIKTSK